MQLWKILVAKTYFDIKVVNLKTKFKSPGITTDTVMLW